MFSQRLNTRNECLDRAGTGKIHEGTRNIGRAHPSRRNMSSAMETPLRRSLYSGNRTFPKIKLIESAGRFSVILGAYWNFFSMRMRNKVLLSLSHINASRRSLVSAAKVLFAPSVEPRRVGILLNTMPKSGSLYAREGLARILGINTMYLGGRYALIDQIDLDKVSAFSRGGYVSQNHLAPSPENLQVLKHFKLKMVLQLRDPRQALLSWVYHLDYITRGNDGSAELLYFIPRTPSGYFKFSLSHKIDWQIANYLPNLIAWTKRWVEIADQGTIPILITHQDDLRCDERAFFAAILAFYQIEFDFELPSLPRTLDETHFRRADPDEWRRTFTPEQAARATAAIPDALQRRFGWVERQSSAAA